MKFQRWWLPILPISAIAIAWATSPGWIQFWNSFHANNSESQEVNPAFAKSPPPTVPSQNLTPMDRLKQQVKPAVVTVYGATGLGSGMIVRSQGLVVTNKHIVGNSGTVKVQTIAGETLSGTVVDFDLRYDLALVKVQPPTTPLPTVTLANQLTLQAGDRIYAIGSPGGQSGTITQGTFTRITEHGSLQTSTGLLNPGNSGGPLLNEQGVVIGINKGLLTDNSGLATPVSAVATLVQRYETVNGKTAVR